MQAVNIISNYQDRTTRKILLEFLISLEYANPESIYNKFVYADPNQLRKINIQDAFDLSDVTVSMYLTTVEGYFIPLSYDGSLLEMSLSFN